MNWRREAVQPGSPGLVLVESLLGPEALDADGAMDRAAVRRIVFGDDGLRQGLETIIHPEVRRLRDEWTAAQRAAQQGMVVWEIPCCSRRGSRAMWTWWCWWTRRPRCGGARDGDARAERG